MRPPGCGGRAEHAFEILEAKDNLIVNGFQKHCFCRLTLLLCFAAAGAMQVLRLRAAVFITALDRVAPWRIAEAAFSMHCFYLRGQSLKRFIKSLLKRYFPHRQQEEFVPAGHFYSAIPCWAEVAKRKSGAEKEPSLPGIDLNIANQLRLLEIFKKFYDEMPFTEDKAKNLRYTFSNSSYCYSDAIFYYCMLRHVQPKRLIEVGSGYSSCLALDVNELFFSNCMEVTFIEPYPALLKNLLKDSDLKKVTLHEKRLQDIPLKFFSNLDKNDILFIDSTHVSKIDSDVNYILHYILPSLKNGVYIHFHDIFYPFEYPREWIEAKRAWNEQYILRAFLECNASFEITFFNTFLEAAHREKILDMFPLAAKNEGGSLWLRKKL